MFLTTEGEEARKRRWIFFQKKKKKNKNKTENQGNVCLVFASVVSDSQS